MIERLRYDLIYIENVSFLVDLRILFHTIDTIFRGRGESKPGIMTSEQNCENKTFRQWLDSRFIALVLWRERHIKEKSFRDGTRPDGGDLLGVAAIVLKYLIHLISSSLTSGLNVTAGNYLYILYPAMGVIIAALYVRYVVRDNISHGVTRVLYPYRRTRAG